MLLKYLFLLFFSRAVCEYFTEDEIDIILSIAEYQSIKHCLIFVKDYSNSIHVGLKKLMDHRLYATVKPLRHLQTFLNNEAVPRQKTAIIFRDFSEGKFHAPGKTFAAYIWLIFKNQERTSHEIEKNCFFPYHSLFLLVTQDNETHYTITEYYKVSEVKYLNGLNYQNIISFKNILGLWTRNENLSIETPEFYKRRLNLQQMRFQYSSSSLTDDYEITLLHVLEMWEELGKWMNFTYAWASTADAISRGIYVEINLSLVALLYDGGGGENLVGPIISEEVYMHIKDNLQDDYYWDSILRPFSLELWIFVLASFVISGISLVIHEMHKRDENKDVFGAFMAPFDVMCSQWALQDHPNSSARITVFSILFCGIFIFNFYTALFTSFLTIRIPRLPFEDLEGFVQDGTYVMGGEQNTYAEAFILAGKSDIIKTIAEKYMLQGDKKIFNWKEAIYRLCSDEKLVFLGVGNDMVLAAKRIGLCNIYQLPRSVHKQQEFLGLNENSTFKEIFNIFFMKKRSCGILKKKEKAIKELKEYFVLYGITDNQEESYEANIAQLIPVMKIIIYGWLLAFIVLGIEFMVKHISNTRITILN